MSEPHLARFARWQVELKDGDVPKNALLAARYQVLNMVAAAHAAARSRETSSLGDGLAGFGGEGRATVLATGRRYPPDQAALANAAYSMAQDFDDIVWMGHTCHSAVFAPLAVAEHEGRSTSELLTAVVVANELAGRLGAASFLGPLNGQMWTFIHLLGAASAAARLLRLDVGQTTHALAIALAQPNFALQPGFMTPTSKLLAAATPTATGIQAAYFARAGMTGAADILEDRRGFFRRFSYLPLTSMLGGLGELWVTETLTIKTFPGCHYFQTACTSIEAILERGGPLALEDVARIEVATTKLGAEATRFAAEYIEGRGAVTPTSAAFDLPTIVALMFVAGHLTSREVEPQWLAAHSEEIERWREIVSVVHDPALSMRTVASARQLHAGRAALKSVRARDLVSLARRYRAEYASQLTTPREAIGWARAALGAMARPGGAQTPPPGHSAVPLQFPSRVTVHLRNGRHETSQTDLPVGSFCAPGVARELEQKFLREVGPSLGEDRAKAAFEAGLAMDTLELAAIVEAWRLEPEGFCLLPDSGSSSRLSES